MPIQITARRDGFRRLGIAHSAKTTTYPDDHFTPDQLKTLETEPQLIVIRVSGKEADAQPDDELQKAFSALQGRLQVAETTISDQLLQLEQKDAALLQLDEDARQQLARIADLEARLLGAEKPAGSDASGESDPDADKKSGKGK